MCRSAGIVGGCDSGQSAGAGRCTACILGCDGPSAHAAAAAQEIELSLGLHALRLTDDLIRI